MSVPFVVALGFPSKHTIMDTASGSFGGEGRCHRVTLAAPQEGRSPVPLYCGVGSKGCGYADKSAPSWRSARAVFYNDRLLPCARPFTGGLLEVRHANLAP